MTKTRTTGNRTADETISGTNLKHGNKPVLESGEDSISALNLKWQSLELLTTEQLIKPFTVQNLKHGNKPVLESAEDSISSLNL